MGTVASIELPTGWGPALVMPVFAAIDERFSLYRPDSELSRIADGRASLTTSSDTMRASYARAVDWRALTGGLFSPHRPDGVLDLNGIVKAEAIEQAGVLLDATGCPTWSINVGGDILVSGGPWPTGVVDPSDPTALLCSVLLGDPRRALATSGSAQRGDHIWLGGSRALAEFVQVSVAANDIVTADVLATAIIAGGRDALDDITDRWDVDVFAVDRSGALAATPGFRRALVGA
ncbi:MAG: FAD:protein FMN transferase [Salinibacterium sp.]|nr:FAD:protein FMN transferase [Salinibacterium sp.]